MDTNNICKYDTLEKKLNGTKFILPIYFTFSCVAAH